MSVKLRRSDDFADKRKTKNLVLQSFDTSKMISASIEVQETLEEALVDLYLSVKIRSNDEVRFLR
jgi:hypothetical protein